MRVDINEKIVELLLEGKELTECTKGEARNHGCWLDGDFNRIIDIFKKIEAELIEDAISKEDCFRW